MSGKKRMYGNPYYSAFSTEQEPVGLPSKKRCLTLCVHSVSEIPPSMGGNKRRFIPNASTLKVDRGWTEMVGLVFQWLAGSTLDIHSLEPNHLFHWLSESSAHYKHQTRSPEFPWSNIAHRDEERDAWTAWQRSTAHISPMNKRRFIPNASTLKVDRGWTEMVGLVFQWLAGSTLDIHSLEPNHLFHWLSESSAHYKHQTRSPEFPWSNIAHRDEERDAWTAWQRSTAHISPMVKLALTRAVRLIGIEF
ncbi:hypothetical protein PO909_030647 [Leuciscus waleckii]